jgi:hypothetical protein
MLRAFTDKTSKLSIEDSQETPITPPEEVSQEIPQEQIPQEQIPQQY